ncbi:MAG: hypothetical protein M0026_00340 [Nocardiopsaceae bacterium]|nr:hypothetical protein [Nocardiopsaceae bacterium]
MWRTLHSEWGKTWSVRAPWICLLTTVALVVITAMSLANDFVYGISIDEVPADARMPMMDAVGPAVLFGQVAFAAFAMQLVTAEYSTGEIRSTLRGQPDRTTVVAAKSLIAAVCGLAVGAASGTLAAGTTRLILADNLASPESYPAVALRCGLLMAVVGILVVAVGALLRNAVATLVTAFAVLIGTLVLPSGLNGWFPGEAGSTFLADDAEPYAGPVGLLVVAVWGVLFLGLGLWSANRRDA